MKNAIEKVEITGSLNDRIGLGWQADGARFHIWLNPDTLEPITVRKGWRADAPTVPDWTLYKNPLVARGQPGHFDTRRLDGTKRSNATMIGDAIAHAKAHKLVEAWRAGEAAKERARDEENAAAHREHLKQQAGPALYDALKIARDRLHSHLVSPEQLAQIDAALKLASP